MTVLLFLLLEALVLERRAKRAMSTVKEEQEMGGMVGETAPNLVAMLRYDTQLYHNSCMPKGHIATLTCTHRDKCSMILH
jgi:hypothetical protein